MPAGLSRFGGVCTVVVRREPGAALRVLAIRDELMSRPFDDPGEWWPGHPGVVGGRDRVAGGSWCVSDVARGTTALVLNRPERRTGTPSRGVLPLAALEHGPDWTHHVDHRDMASFTLLLAGPDGVHAWSWDAQRFTARELGDPTHFVTPNGVDPDDAEARRFGGRFAASRPDAWRALVVGQEPAADRSALVVRHEIGEDVYGTVLGQELHAVPGRLAVSWSRTPWRADGWTSRTWERPPAGTDR